MAANPSACRFVCGHWLEEPGVCKFALLLCSALGVAEPCLSIQANERWAYEYTAKGHLVGVITNGTAVLGLGNIGPLAGEGGGSEERVWGRGRGVEGGLQRMGRERGEGEGRKEGRG